MHARQRSGRKWGSARHGIQKHKTPHSDGQSRQHRPHTDGNTTWFEDCLDSNTSNFNFKHLATLSPDARSRSSNVASEVPLLRTPLNPAEMALKNKFKSDLVAAETVHNPDDVQSNKNKDKKKGKNAQTQPSPPPEEKQASAAKWAFTNLAMFYYETSQHDSFLQLCSVKYLNLSLDSSMESRVGNLILSQMESKCSAQDFDKRLEHTVKAALHFVRGIAISAMAYDAREFSVNFVNEAVIHLQLAETCELIALLITQLNTRNRASEEIKRVSIASTQSDQGLDDLVSRLEQRKRRRTIINETQLPSNEELKQQDISGIQNDNGNVENAVMLVSLVSASQVDLKKGDVWLVHARTHYLLAMGISISHMESSVSTDSHGLRTVRKVAFASMLGVASRLLFRDNHTSSKATRQAASAARALIKQANEQYCPYDHSQVPSELVCFAMDNDRWSLDNSKPEDYSYSHSKDRNERGNNQNEIKNTFPPTSDNQNVVMNMGRKANTMVLRVNENNSTIINERIISAGNKSSSAIATTDTEQHVHHTNQESEFMINVQTEAENMWLEELRHAEKLFQDVKDADRRTYIERMSTVIRVGRQSVLNTQRQSVVRAQELEHRAAYKRLMAEAYNTNGLVSVLIIRANLQVLARALGVDAHDVAGVSDPLMGDNINPRAWWLKFGSLMFIEARLETVDVKGKVRKSIAARTVPMQPDRSAMIAWRSKVNESMLQMSFEGSTPNPNVQQDATAGSENSLNDSALRRVRGSLSGKSPSVRVKSRATLGAKEMGVLTESEDESEENESFKDVPKHIDKNQHIHKKSKSMGSSALKHVGTLTQMVTNIKHRAKKSSENDKIVKFPRIHFQLRVRNWVLGNPVVAAGYYAIKTHLFSRNEVAEVTVDLYAKRGVGGREEVVPLRFRMGVSTNDSQINKSPRSTTSGIRSSVATLSSVVESSGVSSINQAAA